MRIQHIGVKVPSGGVGRVVSPLQYLSVPLLSRSAQPYPSLRDVSLPVLFAVCLPTFLRALLLSVMSDLILHVC